jgi:peptidoglycan/xylan/chitin deacetylase (PgdA/CDA1 family)
VAIWRILDLFEENKTKIPITFYAVARAFERNPHIAKAAEECVLVPLQAAEERCVPNPPFPPFPTFLLFRFLPLPRHVLFRTSLYLLTHALLSARSGGHEVASHCHTWQPHALMSSEEEEKWIRKAVDSFQATSPSGRCPVGWYYGRPSENSVALVEKVYKEKG